LEPAAKKPADANASKVHVDNNGMRVGTPETASKYDMHQDNAPLRYTCTRTLSLSLRKM
jgi:hypothetical protein